MNRRQLFGFAVAPMLIVDEAIAEVDVEVYNCGSHQCAECFCILYVGAASHVKPVTIECTNADCPQFEIKYQFPKIGLQRA